MDRRLYTPLSDATTLRTGGTPKNWITADLEEEFLEVLDAPQFGMVGEEPLLVLGGGSNLVVGDEPFQGTVLQDKRSHIKELTDSCCDGVIVEAAAGTNWDDLVEWSVDNDLSGLEALSGIPGSVGAAPVQNIGAYGREVSQNLISVRAYDRKEGRVFSLPRSALGLAYRDSVIKRSLSSKEAGGGRIWGPTGRWVILSATLCLVRSDQSAPVRYSELAKRLDVHVGESVRSKEVREAVLELRRSKGMVLDSADHDTWSAGSFFTNPILPEKEADRLLPFAAPRFRVTEADGVDVPPPTPGKPADGPARLVKTSAAWLIEKAGFHRGYGLGEDARARLSTKHVLAITNRGGATSSDVIALAQAVRNGVQEYFGISLVPEPVLVGVKL